jgi:hypothetical protein
MMRLDQFLFAALIVGAVCAAEWRMSIGVDVQDYENVQNFFLPLLLCGASECVALQQARIEVLSVNPKKETETPPWPR